MKPYLLAAKLLVNDLASSLLFVVVYSLTKSIALSASLGIAFGFCQVAVQYLRGKRIETMEWVSLLLVIGSGVSSLLTNDPRFVLFKPTIIYSVIGLTMLKPGWINRYIPVVAQQTAADTAVWVGFAWAALMFTSAVLNAYLAETKDLATWAREMALFGIASKTILSIAGVSAIRLTVRRRLKAMPVAERDALLAAFAAPRSV